MQAGGRSSICVLVVVLLVGTGCDGSEPPQSKSPPKSSASSPKDKLKPPARVKPADVKSALTSKNLRGCLYRERLDPSDYAGVYTGPEDLVSDQVETSREVDFVPPPVELLEPKAFDDAVVGNGVNVPVDEAVTTKMLAWALGITPQGVNVNFFLGGNDSRLVAGFYNPNDGNVVIEKKGKLDSEYIVMAHEFTHAAADQAFGLPPKKIEPIVDDASLASSSLVEGDASLAELRVLSRFSPPKAVGKAVAAQLGFKDKFLKDRTGGVPYMLIDIALFPYQWGLAFTCSVFKKEGWKGINRAYSRPPTTSAQILFPDRFLRGEKAQPTPPLGRPGPLWQVRDRGQIGAAHLKAMFEAPGDNESQALSKPLARAAAWAGGNYKVWTVGTAEREYAVGLSFVEHAEHKGLLCSSLERWYQTAFGNAEPKLVADGVVELEGTQQDAMLSCQGRDITMTFAPTVELAASTMGLKSNT
ncbi:MAG: hypothetical protein M3285_03150 [Actinomycetota bacterium]|nr:hypothetical protein [Actinomycetota bacterium]